MLAPRGAGPKAVRAVDPFRPEEIRRLVRRFGSPLLIVDCERVRRQFRRLQRALPDVALHYALKPLPHPAVVRTVLEEGGGLDLATTGEVQLAMRVGAAAARCIHTHPIKRAADIENALAAGLRTFVADNPDELEKLAPYRDQVELLLRVAFRAPDAVCDLSRKFGCTPADALPLARAAAGHGLRVRGMSFHVGSQVIDADKHVEAIGVCAQLLRQAGREKLGACDTLDIGGGFPVPYRAPVPPIGRLCAPIRAALAGLPRRVRVLAEPGRFIAAPAAIAVATVTGRARRGGIWWYYLDDGVYGAYSGQLYDHARYRVESLRSGGARQRCVLAGPTCDSIDVIAEDLPMPELHVGELVIGHNMGAYTWATASEFNFFPKPTVVAVNSPRGDPGSVTQFPL